MLETYAALHSGATRRNPFPLDPAPFGHTNPHPAPHDRPPTRLRLEIANDKPWLQASVAALIHRMYASRGLQIGPEAEHPPGHAITLAASADRDVLGTLSLRIDGEHGLLADQLYRNEIDAIRKAGGVVCEATRLALHPQPNSHGLLAMLFNAAFVIARSAHRCTDLIMECHPRHANYYQRMLACDRIGELAICPRVGAPAVLLRLSLARAEHRIARHHEGGMRTAKDLYRHSLSPQAQRTLCRTLLAQH